MIPRPRHSSFRLHRRDLPFVVAALVLLLLFACSVAARAADTALEEITDEVAKQVSGQVSRASGVSALSGLTVVGMLWYILRVLYADKKETDTKLLGLTEKYATLAERTANSLENISAGKTATGRFPREHDPHAAG